MSEHQLRIGDADRDRAAADLGEHFAEGRLSAEEHAERLDAVWTARTQADLTPIFEDLPSRPSSTPASSRGRSHPGPPWRTVPFLPIAIVLVVLSVITHLPFWILIFFVGCGLFSHRRRTHSWH